MSSFREPPPRPFLKWVGGKTQLLPELLKTVEAAQPYRHYHEPFLGGGALFFALARTGRLKETSYLSDVNQNLTEAYIGLRDETEVVIELLKEHRTKHSEKYYYKVRGGVPHTLAERAARLIYLNKTCYNGLYRENSKGQFNAPFGRYKSPLICDEENLRAVAKALSGVNIATKGFALVLGSAKRGDLVYFDPPYHPVSETANFTAYSRGGFPERAQRDLRDICARLTKRGVKTILSNSMTDFTRTLYKDYFFYRVFANRVVNSRAERRGKVQEALITNFRLLVDGERILEQHIPLPHGTDGGIERIQAREWLIKNNYRDVGNLIDEVLAEWRSQGKLTRRNWWGILAGDTHGNPRTVAGRTFPILRSAQLRQGVPVSSAALCRNPKEEIPPICVTARWSQE
jgi:DNA adenine methylase